MPTFYALFLSKKNTLSLFALLLMFSTVIAQTGGNRVYNFLNFPSSARVTAAGGNLITITDADIALAYHNPALLNPSMHHRMTAGTAAYYAGLNFGYFGYGFDKPGIATFQAGIQYVSYGSFNGADENGTLTGEFRANDLALNFGASRKFYDKYSYGVNLKLIASNYEKYSSYGMATDWAVAYFDSSKNITATLLLKNIGFQFKPYIAGNRDPLPFEIQMGFSKRLKHVPFRISIVAHNLQRFNMRYEEPDNQSQVVFGDTLQDEKKAAQFFDNVARHFILSGEFYLGKVITVGFGYNHHRRQELAVATRKGLAGFSFGMGLNVKMFNFSYARGRYHLAGASNHFTVGIDINRFMKKNKIEKPVKEIIPPDNSTQP